MRCPVCKKELVITGQARLETLEEHIFDSNGIPALKDKYQCVNEKCAAHIYNVCWDNTGGYYSRLYSYPKKIKFIDDNTGPFGSWARRQNIEIYKHDENFDLLNLYWFKIRVEFKYKANENGDILSRKRHFHILLRNDIGWVYWISPIKMFFFHMAQFRKFISIVPKNIVNSKNPSFYIRKLNEYFNDTDKRAYRKVAKIFINLFYKKWRKLIE